jgi:hypothetical protein
MFAAWGGTILAKQFSRVSRWQTAKSVYFQSADPELVGARSAGLYQGLVIRKYPAQGWRPFSNLSGAMGTDLKDRSLA